MNKEEFINISKRMVKEYFNRYIIDNTDDEIKDSDVQVVIFDDTSDHYKTTLTTPDLENLYYGVTYDKRTQKLYSFIYEKDGFRVLGKTVEK